jgi:hypothetical protein
MKRKKKPSLSIAEHEAAARRLAGTAQERQAYLRLLEQEPPTVDTKQLAEAAADGVPDLYVARKTLHDVTIEQLAAALRLALALSRDPKKLAAFYEHPYWSHKKPNRGKLLLLRLQFALPPRNTKERKNLSKFAASISWMVLQGYGPDGLARGFGKEGGRSACAAKYANWRREHKGVYEDQSDQAIQQKKDVANKSADADDSSTTGVTSAAVGLPVRFVQGLGQKIRERKPPADRDYFWVRAHHHGDRITIVEMMPDRPNSPRKALKLAKKTATNRALPVNSSRRKNTKFRQRRKLLAEAGQIVMASVDRQLG